MHYNGGGRLKLVVKSEVDEGGEKHLQREELMELLKESGKFEEVEVVVVPLNDIFAEV